MNINNNQWITIVLITAALMLVFLVFVFYGNKTAQLPPVAPPEVPNIEKTVSPEQANPPAIPATKP